MATADHFCTLCLEDGNSLIASSWCSDCENFLCTECATHHRRNKASKTHDLVTVENVKNLPAFVLEKSNQCDAHERMNEFYCQVHQVACCVHCIKADHKDCRELVPLSDILTDIKSSAAVSHLESDIKKLISNYEVAMTAITDKIKNIEDEKMKCTEEIRQAREKINSHLDDLEKELEEELTSQCSELETNLQNLQEEFASKMKDIQQVEEDFANIKLVGTNLQAFSALKSYEKLAQEEYTFLRKLQDEGKLRKLSFKIDAFPSSGIIELKSIGKLIITDVEKGSFFDTETAVQIPKCAVKIDEIHPVLIYDLQMVTKVSTLRNCLICPNGEKIFVDQNKKRLVMYSQDNTLISKISLSSKPCDICNFGNNSVAVTFYGEHLISVIEPDSKKIEKSVKVQYQCFGIECDRQHFYVSFATEGKIGILDFDGNTRSIIDLGALDITEIAVSESRIYCSNSKINAVSCYAISGVLIWTYNDTDIQRSHALSVDRNSFVYVACSGSNKVIVISPDGKRSKEILTDKNKIHSPTALHINKELSLLLLGSWSTGRAFLYQL